jgi:hypothetical protein
LVGAIRLPDGAWVRGRGISRPLPPGPEPEFGLYLGVSYDPLWEHAYIDWPDFRLPRDPPDALRRLRGAHARALDAQRVEIACAGGHGRTGTALCALAVFGGIDPREAVDWVRTHYDPRAVETPWQRRWVTRLPALLDDPPPS